MIDLWKCEICNCTKEETSRAYMEGSNQFKKDLCKKHYMQMYRHGRITEWDKKPVRRCDICGDTYKVQKCGSNSSKYDNRYVGMELCTKHYSQVRRNGKVVDKTPSHLRDERICSFCGSIEDVLFCTTTKVMLCVRHHSQQQTYGKLFERTVYDKNEIIVKDDHAEILLYDKNHVCIAQALIDLDDVEMARQYKWCLGSGYVITGNESLHRIIMSKNNDINGKIIDHIDRDPLNNKKENLRIACKSMNAINAGLRSSNTSGVTGVSYIKATDKWRVYINYKGERIELGHINDKQKAIKKRLLAELKFYGDDAPQKHLFREYNIEREVMS